MTEVLIGSPQWALAHGFGVNTNFLETNLFNLAIVIGVLGYFGKGVLIDILSNRKARIVSQIEDAQKRLEEATNKLIQAERELEIAKEKAIIIDQDAHATVEFRKRELTQSTRDREKRLQDATKAIFSFAKSQAFETLRQRLFRLALQEVKKSLAKRITADVHAKINDHQLGVLKLMPK